MSLPYKRIPAGIAAFTDPTGKLPASQLSHVAGVGDFQLQAARAMRALVAAAKADGLTVATVGDYRSYAEQVILFEQRYSPNVSTSRCYQWKGQRWCLKPGAAGAAYPGTSNHGLGLANDFALNVNGRIVSLDQTVNGVSLWSWLGAHGRTYGWSWGEALSERWHWVYIEGDVIPAAVLAFENPIQPIPPPGDDMSADDVTAINAHTDAKIAEVTTFLTKMLRGDGVGSDSHDNESVEGAVAAGKAAGKAATDGTAQVLDAISKIPAGSGGLSEDQARALLNRQRITTDDPPAA